MEKSSKNLISVFGEKPARGLPKPPPTPPLEKLRSLHVEITRFQDADADLGHGEGGGGNNAKLNNSGMKRIKCG